MKYFVSMLATAILLPLVASATTTVATTTTATNSPVSIQEVMQTEKVEHERVAFNLGIPRRFSSSPAGLADLDLTPSSVLNERLLELYVRKLALTEPVSNMIIDEEAVTLTIEAEARLLGLIPAAMPYHISADLADGLGDITIENQTVWSWLATNPSSEVLVDGIRTQMSEVQYLSTTQLKAYLLEAIIETVAG